MREPGCEHCVLFPRLRPVESSATYSAGRSSGGPIDDSTNGFIARDDDLRSPAYPPGFSCLSTCLKSAAINPPCTASARFYVGEAAGGSFVLLIILTYSHLLVDTVQVWIALRQAPLPPSAVQVFASLPRAWQCSRRWQMHVIRASTPSSAPCATASG